MDFYDKQGEPIGMKEWEKLFEDQDYSHIKKTALPNGKEVLTVWIGIDYRDEQQDRPLIFETMVFSENTPLYGKRYSTLDEAVEGHELVLKRFKDE